MAQIRDDLSTKTRVYLQTTYGDPAVERIREAIGRSNLHYDREKGAGIWWVAIKFRAEIEAILRDGGNLDPRNPVERAARADQLEEQGRTDEAVKMRESPPQEDPAKVRLVGKGEYKGRSYYIACYTKDRARCRLVTLPDASGKYLDFWADASLVRVTKTYQPREVWDGRRYSGRTVTQHVTLGSIARFIAKQKDPETARGQCTECGEWGPAGQTCRECHEGTHC